MPLADLQHHLDSLRAGTLGVTAFCEAARATPLPDALPSRFGEVLHNLCDRLESSALFDGESCSFSQTDLFEAFQTWLDRAGERLRG